jgi:hypothetical protein
VRERHGCIILGTSENIDWLRDLLGLLAVTMASWPVTALAQVPPKRLLIGVILGASQVGSKRWREGLPQGLHELGYAEVGTTKSNTDTRMVF